VSARVVVGGSVDRPVRMLSVERLISSELPEKERIREGLFGEFERLTMLELEGSAAMRDNTAYMKNLTAVLVRRAVREAVERWNQE
jgi:CO/xanthine dehydrogenase FAD-binding subunit